MKENSRAQAVKISEWIGNDKKKFKSFLDIFLHGEYRVAQLSAHTLSFVAEKYPRLVEQNIRPIVKRLYNDNIHTAVKRNVVRILQFLKIPKSIHAEVINLCMAYLADPNETIAVRCFSMNVLASFLKQYPEIKSEFKAVLSSRFNDTKGGLKVRVREVLKEIEAAGISSKYPE